MSGWVVASLLLSGFAVGFSLANLLFQIGVR